MDSSGNSLSPDEHTHHTLPISSQEHPPTLTGEPSGGELKWTEILRTLLFASIFTLWICLTGVLSLRREPIQTDPPFILLRDGDGGAEYVEQETSSSSEPSVRYNITKDSEDHEDGDIHSRENPRGSIVHGHSEHLLPTPRVAMNNIVITRIQATAVTAGLGQTPVGFYIAVQFDGVEWRTSNKPAMVDDDTLGWDDAIILPLEVSARVRLEIRASYEFAPMLGSGDELSAANVTVGELISHSARGLPIAFFPRDEESFSHSSLLVTVERRECEITDLEATLPYRPPDSERLRRVEEATDLGHNALSRYRKHGKKQDLEQTLGQHQRALNICPYEHPCRAAALCNLALAKLINYRVNRSRFDIEDSIAFYHDALGLRPSGHPDRPATLCQLAIALLVQSQNQQYEIHVVQGEELLHQVLELSSTESFENRTASLMLETQRVWNAARTQQVGEPLAWTWADFIQGFADDEPADLGAQLVHRFQRYGDVANLQLGISLLAAHKRSISHWNRRYPGIMCNLGAAFLHRFRRFGELADLDQAIAGFEDGVQFAPHGHPDRVACLSNLGVCFRTRFDRLGHLGDLDQAIARQQNVVQLTPDGHPDLAGRLNSLGVSFSTRFDRLGSLPDLDQAIVTFEESLRLTSDDHTDRASRLNNLGVLYKTRFRRHGDIGDIDRAIATHEDAVRLTPDAHPDYAGRLNNLGISFSTRFQRLGDLIDLDRAIERQESAARLTPEAHPDRAGRLNNLGVSFKTRFDRLGDIRDLDQAISNQQESVRLTPDDHHDRAGHLNNLGVTLSTRFNRLGDIGDLDQAIASQEEAVRITPSDHPDRPGRLDNLGVSRRNRFRQLGDLDDLNQAVVSQEEAVGLGPRDHPDRAGHLNNLGVSLNTRFCRVGDLGDLNQAITRQEEAVQLTPINHPDRSGRLSNLGISFRTRFDRTGDRVDLEQAIATQEEAIQLTPLDHPSRVPYLHNLGLSFLASFNRLSDRSALEKALLSFSSAAESATGPTSVRFSASRKWISCARLLGRSSVLDAYSVALQLIPQLAWIGLPLHDRYRELLRAADVTREAASAALEYGQAERAVEWLEQGRSVVWNELFQLRAPLAELRAAHPTLAQQLLEVSSALEHVSARDEPTSESLEDQARRHRSLALERERLLGVARSFPGFERLLLGMSFTQLTASTHSGSVVYLNASTRGCDALMILAHVDSVLHVPLPDITITQAETMVNVLDSLVSGGRGVKKSSRPDFTFADTKDLCSPIEMSHLSSDGRFQLILSLLWTKVVRPVLDALAFSTPGGDLCRIFWCPTGPFVFLPIHAAGLYDTQEPGSKLSDFAVSSYTPTLSALIPKPELNMDRPASTHGKHIRLLTVCQPDSDGQARLLGALEETEYIKALSRSSNSSPFISLVESNATVEDVMEKMKESNWVHFACHGVQGRSLKSDVRAATTSSSSLDGCHAHADLVNPLDSGLVLADGRRLKLSDIIKLSRPHRGFAFLSACHTATGDGQLSEEAVHLAAGMLFAGYSSVIATSWAITDRDASEVAKGVYERLFRASEVPDSTQSARALHDAVQRLRERRGVPFASWVPFIHIGL